MAMDREFKDTIMHRAGNMLKQTAQQCIKGAGLDRYSVRSTQRGLRVRMTDICPGSAVVGRAKHTQRIGSPPDSMAKSLLS
jgi:hypothetical protein